MSFQKISDLTGYVPQTVKNQVDKYFKGGLSAVVTETRGGRHRSYLTVEEEQAFFKKILDSSIDAGEMVTTTLLFEAYQEEIGQEVPRQTFYALLKAPWLGQRIKRFFEAGDKAYAVSNKG
ncbi:helix-turn-helix domain-containing protein [Streptococcus suis]|nr:helix-turn-helix domain-containing protein [Streptococcus suis]